MATLKERDRDDYVLNEEKEVVYFDIGDIAVTALKMSGSDKGKAKDLVCGSMVDSPEREMVLTMIGTHL